MSPISLQPVALTVAGSDCSAGAGIQADLKTLQQLDVHGLCAITSIVSETPLEVREIAPVATSLVQSQIQILLETYPIAAIKTGMLPSSSCIISICKIFQDLDIPIVTDPVMVASSGRSLMEDDAAATMSEHLIPLSTLVTPNIPEASSLLDREINCAADLTRAAKDIAEKFQTSCLIKGGHLPAGDDRLDLLWHHGEAYPFSHPDAGIGAGIHGTGCTLSSAITANLAHGKPLQEAVAQAIAYVQRLITESKTWHHLDHEVTCLGW